MGGLTYRHYEHVKMPGKQCVGCLGNLRLNVGERGDLGERFWECFFQQS